MKPSFRAAQYGFEASAGALNGGKVRWVTERTRGGIAGEASSSLVYDLRYVALRPSQRIRNIVNSWLQSFPCFLSEKFAVRNTSTGAAANTICPHCRGV